jgi:hypothetical protein
MLAAPREQHSRRGYAPCGAYAVLWAFAAAGALNERTIFVGLKGHGGGHSKQEGILPVVYRANAGGVVLRRNRELATHAFSIALADDGWQVEARRVAHADGCIDVVSGAPLRALCRIHWSWRSHLEQWSRGAGASGEALVRVARRWCEWRLNGKPACNLTPGCVPVSTL